MSHFDQRMVIVSQRAAAGGLAAGMIYGAGLSAFRENHDPGELSAEGSDREQPSGWLGD